MTRYVNAMCMKRLSETYAEITNSHLGNIPRILGHTARYLAGGYSGTASILTYICSANYCNYNLGSKALHQTNYQILLRHVTDKSQKSTNETINV